MKDDQLYEFAKVEILIHEKDMSYFNHTKLDYTKDIHGKGKFQLITI